MKSKDQLNPKWDVSILRSLTHSLQYPDISDVRVDTYVKLINSILLKLPNKFTIENVQEHLISTYGFKTVSKLLISQALHQMSRKLEKDEEYLYNVSDFDEVEKSAQTLFSILVTLIIERYELQEIILDEQEQIIVNDLIECTLYALSESIDDVILSFYNDKSIISDNLVDNIKNYWTQSIKKYDLGFGIRYNDIIEKGIIALKYVFSEKDKISDIMGIIGSILIYRGFICADPELKALEEDLLKDSLVILDTNVIIAYLCQGCIEHDEISWLLEGMNDLGVNIVITDKTVEEYQRTLLKDNIRYSILNTSDESDLAYAERDIPMGFYRKWSKIGTWTKYMSYLDDGIEQLKKSLDISVLDVELFRQDIFSKAIFRIKETIPPNKYKDPQALAHDASLLLQGHKLQNENQKAKFPAFILSREKKLTKSEDKLIHEDNIIPPPNMIITPDALIEILLPFFSVKVEDKELQISILGKMISNSITSIDKTVIEYLMEYVVIETKLGDDGAQRINELALDEHLSLHMIMYKDDHDTYDYASHFATTIKSKLDNIDKSDELEAKLERLVALAKDTEIEPIISIAKSSYSDISKLLLSKLPIFCDPKPKNEKEFQREIYKLLRSKDYKPNWDSDASTFSGRGSKPDFTLPEEKIAIEAKYIGDKTNLSTIIEEMAADCIFYSENFEVIIFVVYDLNSKIADEEIFKHGFEKLGHIVITIK